MCARDSGSRAPDKNSMRGGERSQFAAGLVSEVNNRFHENRMAGSERGGSALFECHCSLFRLFFCL